MSTQGQHHPPFWGLRLSAEPGAQVLILEDRLDERQTVLERLLDGCEMTWASDIDQAQQSLDAHGPFDMYCLDYDLGADQGGWLAAGELIRKCDPRSVAKIVLIHSANIDAREYFRLFPAAIFIQWDVLATILGMPSLDDALVEAVLARASPMASEDELRQIAVKTRSLPEPGGDSEPCKGP